MGSFNRNYVGAFMLGEMEAITCTLRSSHLIWGAKSILGFENDKTRFALSRIASTGKKVEFISAAMVNSIKMPQPVRRYDVVVTTCNYFTPEGDIFLESEVHVKYFSELGNQGYIGGLTPIIVLASDRQLMEKRMRGSYGSSMSGWFFMLTPSVKLEDGAHMRRYFEGIKIAV